jgi:hypothetical protein
MERAGDWALMTLMHHRVLHVDAAFAALVVFLHSPVSPATEVGAGVRRDIARSRGRAEPQHAVHC